MKAYTAILAFLALVAMLASPTFAQGEVTDDLIVITVDCGSLERLTVANGLDVTLRLEGISSSEDREGDPEIAFNVEIASHESVTEEFGTSGGSGNIFENGAGEMASVYLSGREYRLLCGPDDTGVAGFNPYVRAEPGQGIGQDTSGGEEEGRVPEEMPDTGVGGLANGIAGVPLGGLAAAVSMLLGAAGFAVLRRR